MELKLGGSGGGYALGKVSCDRVGLATGCAIKGGKDAEVGGAYVNSGKM